MAISIDRVDGCIWASFERRSRLNGKTNRPTTQDCQHDRRSRRSSCDQWLRTNSRLGLATHSASGDGGDRPGLVPPHPTHGESAGGMAASIIFAKSPWLCSAMSKSTDRCLPPIPWMRPESRLHRLAHASSCHTSRNRGCTTPSISRSPGTILSIQPRARRAVSPPIRARLLSRGRADNIPWNRRSRICVPGARPECCPK